MASYSEAQLTALRSSLAFLALFALLSLAWVRRLPDSSAAVEAVDAAAGV